jgi:hypothetical protein
LEPDAGAYIVTGNDAAILRGFLLEADAGIYTVTGNDVGLVLSRVLGLDTGSYTLDGKAATLEYSGTLLQIYAVSAGANVTPTVIIIANPVPEKDILVG